MSIFPKGLYIYSATLMQMNVLIDYSNEWYTPSSLIMQMNVLLDYSNEWSMQMRQV